MKLVLAIVQDLDANTVIDTLTEEGFRVTRIASTGGFFRRGNTVLLSGIEDDQVAGLLKILRKTCQQRSRIMPIASNPTDPSAILGAYVEVPVGGATVFVLNVDRFEHI